MEPDQRLGILAKNLIMLAIIAFIIAIAGLVQILGIDRVDWKVIGASAAVMQTWALLESIGKRNTPSP